MANNVIQFGLKINADTSDARAELDRLKQILGQLGTGSQFKLNAKQEIREASVAAQQLQKHLAAATSKTGDFDINRFTASIKKGEMSLSQMSMKLMQLGTEGTNAFRTLSTQILNAQKPALSFSNILTKMGTTLANNIRWQLSSAAINAFTGGVQEAWNYTKNMDKALTNIRIVTGESREEMDKLAAASNRMAKELRSTTEEMVKGQLIFYQQGDSAALAAEKARITAMAANVSFESSQEEMADYLTAIWNSYQVGENQLELFVDKLSAVGASTATSMEEIATGMTKVASAANAVGVTYDQLNATIATISSTTRVSAESVGTAMKTIYARMGDLKVGKTDEDGITYGQVSKQMKQMGIDIADANGQLRNMGEVVEEIGNKWKTFSKEEQQALVQAVAGKRQYTNLTALFENWDMYLNTLETSKNAMGTLQKQQDAWADSIEGASNRVASSLEGLYSRILNDDVIINMTNGLASFLEYFTGLIDALGGLETILPAITGLMVSTFAPAIVSGLTSGMMNLRTLFGGWMIDLQKSRDGLIQMANAPGFDRLSAEQQKLILNKRDLAIAQNEYVNNSRHMTAQQKQEAQFAIETAQALQVTITELEATAQAYKDAALASKNFSTAGGANIQNLNAGSATMAFQKAFSVVNSNQGFFSPALKQQLDDIQTKIQSGVKPSVDELKNAIIAYNNEVNNLNAGGAPANIEELGKAFDKLMTKMSKAQAQMEGYRTLANNLKAKSGGGFIFDTKDITITNQIRQALKDVGVEASKIEQILKDGVIPDGVLGPDITDVKSLESAANKAEKTLNRFAKLGNKKFSSPVEELRKSAKVTRDHTLANEDYVASLEKAKGAAKGFGVSLTTAIGGVTSLTFSLSSLKSAGDAIASGDWLTGISSGLMGLTMAGSGIKSIASGIVAMHGEGGAAIKGLAQAMNGMGLTFQKTGTLVTNTAMSAATAWASVLGPILAITAALAALGAAIYLVAKDMKKAETNAKSAAEQAKTFSTEFENANQELTDLKSNFENYNTGQSALDKMTEGTEEFRKALQEANEEVIDLMTKYPELAEYVNDVNGRLKITAEGQRKLLEAQQAEVDRAYANKLSSNIVAIESRQEANEQKLAGKILKDKASATGETVGTALGAAAAGAAIGAFAGPIGAIIGGLVGAAAGTAGGYFGFGADDRNNKEHGLDKFTHAIETQGINILSSYESLERALDGDSELAKALWENKEETNKLAREIIANKKQIDLNTKQLIIANNPEVAGSKYSSDITNIGKDIVQNEGRINKYKEEIKAMFADGDQDAMDAYLKAMYGDEADKYRIVNKGGTGNTLQKQNDDGTWTTQGEKNSLTNDVIIDNYAAKMASNLTDAEVKAIEKVSKGLKERIQNYTEGNGDEIVKKIIDEYGGTPEKALKYIEEQGAGYYAVFTKHLSEGIDKAFSGSNNRVKAEEEALKFALENNPAFEGLEEAFRNNDDEALKSYLADFQEMGLLIGHNLETFKIFKNEIMDGNLASGINVLANKYWSQDFVDLTGTNLETGTKQQLNKYDQIENVKISNSELQSQTEALLANSGLTEYQISQVVLDVLKAGKFTEEIENKVNHMIANAKSFAESSISDISIQHLEFDTTKEYFDTLKNGAFEAEEYRQAIEALNNTEYSRMEITKDGIVLYDKQGAELDTVIRDTMAFNAVLKDGLAPLDAFDDKLGKDAYSALVKYNKEIGRTDEETNKFLDVIDNFDPKIINELSKNLSEGNFESFKLENGVLTFYDKYENEIQEVAGELEDLEALAKSIDPTFEVGFGFNIEDTLAGLKEAKAKIEEEISSWNLDFSKPIALTTEQSNIIDNFLPNVDWSDYKRKLANGYYKTMDEFMADIKAKKLESIAIGLDIDTTALNPSILYEYAEALGIPKEKADELKVAFQQLADNGIAYASKDAKGNITYFDEFGNELTDLNGVTLDTTAQLIALGRNGLKPLSEYDSLSPQLYNDIVAIGTASGMSKTQIEDLLGAVNNLNGIDFDNSNFINSCFEAGGAAMAALRAALAFSNLKIVAEPRGYGMEYIVEKNGVPIYNTIQMNGTSNAAEQWAYEWALSQVGDKDAFKNQFYSDLGIGVSGRRGYVPPPTTNTTEDDDDKDGSGITETGGGGGGSGDSEISKILSQIDQLQDAYKTLNNIIEEYNEHQALSVDSFQTLMELEPRYLGLLINEQGQLELNSDAIYKVTAARIREAAAKKAQEIVDMVLSANSEAEALHLLELQLDNTTEGYLDAARAAAEFAYQQGKISEEVYTANITTLKGLETITEATVDGLSNDGLTGFKEKDKKDENAEQKEADERIKEAAIAGRERDRRIIEKMYEAGEISSDEYLSRMASLPNTYTISTGTYNILDAEALSDETKNDALLDARADLKKLEEQLDAGMIDYDTYQTKKSEIMRRGTYDYDLGRVLPIFSAEERLNETKDDTLLIARKDLKSLEEQFDAGKIDYSTYKTRKTEIMRRGVYDADLNQIVPIFSAEERADADKSLGKDAISTYFDNINSDIETGMMTVEDGFGKIRTTLANDIGSLSPEEQKQLREQGSTIVSSYFDGIITDIEVGETDIDTALGEMRKTFTDNLDLLTPEDELAAKRKIASTISSYFEDVNSDIEAGLIDSQTGIDKMKAKLVDNLAFLPQEELLSLRQSIVSVIENEAAKIQGAVEKEYITVEAGLTDLWDLIEENKDILSPSDLEKIFETIDKVVENGIDNIVSYFSNGVYDIQKSLSEFKDILKEGWGIEISASTWNSLGKTVLETLERQGLVKKWYEDMLKSVEDAWKNAETTFQDGMSTILTILEDGSFVFTETEKAMYSNSQKQLEKYISIQEQLYKDGGQSLKETIDNLEEVLALDPYLVENNMLSFVNEELDEIIEKVESGAIESAAQAIAEAFKILTSADIDNFEQFNEASQEFFDRTYSIDLKSIQEKYDAENLAQEAADWGMYVDVNEDGIAGPFEFAFSQWQKEMADVQASFDSFVANYRGTEDIRYNKTYQEYTKTILSLQKEGETLADKVLAERYDYIQRRKDLGVFSIDDEINAYNMLDWDFKQDSFRQYFATEEDYLKWLQEKELAHYEISKQAHLNKVKEIQAQLTEDLEFKKKKLEAEKALEESLYDSQMELRDLQHEINLDLETSLTMYEYLDEETRKLIFNEEDYLALSNEILKIQDELNSLANKYQQKILTAEEEDLEKITKEFERQKELKMQEYEIAKANLDITKKQLALQNTLNERNTRMFINGQWTWVANQENVQKARKELSQAEYDLETAELNREHKINMNQLDVDIQNVDDEIQNLEKAVKDLEDLVNGKENSVIVTLEEFAKAVEATKTRITQGGDTNLENRWDKGIRDEQGNIIRDNILDYFKDMKNLKGEEQKDKIFIVGDDTYKYEVIDRYGTYGWTKNGENLGNINWKEVLRDTILFAYGKLDDKALYESYVATYKANAPKEEAEEIPGYSEKPYGGYNSKYEQNMAQSVEDIVSILSNMLIVDEKIKKAYETKLNDIVTNDTIGDHFVVGDYVFTERQKKGEDGKLLYDENGKPVIEFTDQLGRVYSTEKIYEIIARLYEATLATQEKARSTASTQTEEAAGETEEAAGETEEAAGEIVEAANTVSAENVSDSSVESEVTTEATDVPAQNLWYQPGGAIKRTDQELYGIYEDIGGKDTVNRSLNPEEVAKRRYGVTTDDTNMGAIVITDPSKLYQQGINSSLTKKNSKATLSLALANDIDTAYGGSEYSAAYWEAVYDAISKAGEDLTPMDLLAIMGAYYKGGPDAFLETFFKDNLASSSYLSGLAGSYFVPNKWGQYVTTSEGYVQGQNSADSGSVELNKVGETAYYNKVAEITEGLVGTIDANGNLKTMDGTLVGAVDENGYLRTNDNNLLGVIGSDGSLKTADGVLVGAKTEDGKLKVYSSSTDQAIANAARAISRSINNIDRMEPRFFARGDLINRPTLSWVGEDGPEAIIPLSQKYRARGLSLWEEATKALGITPNFTMPTIRTSFPQEKENMNVSQTINVTVQNEDSSNDFYAITNLL